MINLIKTVFLTLVALVTGNYKTANKTGIVIVGMQNSAKYGGCPGAAVDAGRMVGILSRYGKPVVLQDRQATKTAVVKALTDAVQNNDLVIFFYSGHGGSDPIGDVSTEPDGKNEYLCLYNTYILDNEIWAIASQAKGRVFMIFDCCHSETMFRSPGIDLAATLERVGVNENARLEYGLKPRGNNVNMLVWSGCPDNGYSNGSDTGGFLTNAIVAALKRHSKLATYNQIWREVNRNTTLSQQSPRRTVIGHGFGGPVFR